MTYAGTIYRFQIDYNSLSADDMVGTLLKHSDSLQPQVFPPVVGDIVIADDPDVNWPRWATVVERSGEWVGLHLLEPLPTFVAAALTPGATKQGNTHIAVCGVNCGHVGCTPGDTDEM